MKISHIEAKQMLVKSNLPASDYVVNAYMGCTHKCRYCYASFMQRFNKHDEEWGEFLDIKEYKSLSLPRSIDGKTVLLSSVTDPYNPYEIKYHRSREILEKLAETNAKVEILSKSDLMLNDIDLLCRIPNLRVGISLCTLDDDFRKDIESCAPSVNRRLNALEKLHRAGIETYLFISPIFPYITDISAIAKQVSGTVDMICFENLNLRGSAKTDILSYIGEKYPQYYEHYDKIYNKKDFSYWNELEKKIETLSAEYEIPFVNYFYHDKIKKGGKKHD